MAVRVGLCRLSDPVSETKLQQTIAFLRDAGFEVLCSPYLESDVGPERLAAHLHSWFKADVDYIFDVSGGDLAIECIGLLDASLYQTSRSLFFGYSDLTPVLNILGQAKPVVLFQIRNTMRQKELLGFLKEGNQSLFADEKTVAGGNIRCLLKTAGTAFFPDLTGRDLFLESRSGNSYRIRSYFQQLKIMGVFDQIRSLSLGQFTELDASGQRKVLRSLTKDLGVPVTELTSVGHARDSKALWIGTKSDTL